MSNGYSVEKMIELILKNQEDMKQDIKSLDVKLDTVALFGCAHREDDLRRVKALEEWKVKGILGLIATLIMSLGAILGMIFGGLPPHHP